jgi:hypothetical protein
MQLYIRFFLLILVDIGAFVCSTINHYQIGQILSAVVFSVHLFTMISDAIMRCTKTKGSARSLIRFLTTVSFKVLGILVILVFIL